MSQPAIVEKMLANKDLVANGEAISKSIMANQAERKRRSVRLKKMIRDGKIVPKKSGYGVGHKMSPYETVVSAMFPEAKFNFHVKTGLASKLGQVSNYYLDFAWPDIKLNVEVDGCYHMGDVQKKKDLIRTAFLKRQGWTELRFSHPKLKYDPTGVRNTIASTILKLRDTRATLPEAS